ncbi:hypothetical protein PILCRDRAFT_114128 [Piloderma croceum F 1598]|uniref:Uncharacterized protein n=1 Tax=Piloderma croceum (strain F 1598) TaxID=765440 RepID=A0A0C3GNU2_PILCF|nr:hypothetical protein PILCRDRAFT_114128 [Piloderma croceum F 1598]
MKCQHADFYTDCWFPVQAERPSSQPIVCPHVILPCVYKLRGFDLGLAPALLFGALRSHRKTLLVREGSTTTHSQLPMYFPSSLPALLFQIPILPRILADSRINATAKYLLDKANVVIETHLTAPTPTKPRPFIHSPTAAPKRLPTFSSPPPHRPLFLAAHSISSTSSPFTFLDAFILGSIIFGVYVALVIYCQCNRLTELEKSRITAYADLEAIHKTFRMTEKAHRKETRMIQEKFAHVASFVEETERCAEEAAGKLKAITTKIGEMEKVRDEEKRVAKEGRIQQWLDDTNRKVEESEKASQKDRDDLKRSIDQFSFKLRKEMMEKVEAANRRAEEAKNELEGYMKSSRTPASTGDAREHNLRAESEERIMSRVTEMTGKHEKRHRKEMDKLRADHRNDLDQLRAENVKREIQRAQELNRVRSKDTAGQEAWFLSIKHAIMKDEAVQVEERRKEMEVRLLEKEEERAALSKMRSDISRSANSILSIKSKSVVRVMEQLKWKRETQEQLIALSKDINECRWDLKQVRKARLEAVGVDGRGRGIALIPTPAVSHGPSSPEVSLHGLPTPAASQSPPPHVKATFPLKQAVTVTDRQTVGTNVGPILATQVIKQEETSFDFQRAAFYAPLEAKVSVRIGVAASENVSSLVASEQSISLSNGYSGDDLLTITPPRWSDSSIFESSSFDDAFHRAHILCAFFTLSVVSRSALIISSQPAISLEDPERRFGTMTTRGKSHCPIRKAPAFILLVDIMPTIPSCYPIARSLAVMI